MAMLVSGRVTLVIAPLISKTRNHYMNEFGSTQQNPNVQSQNSHLNCSVDPPAKRITLNHTKQLPIGISKGLPQKNLCNPFFATQIRESLSVFSRSFGGLPTPSAVDSTMDFQHQSMCDPIGLDPCLEDFVGDGCGEPQNDDVASTYTSGQME